MNVRILKKLIRTLQAKITCPGCGAKFTKPEQVQFRGYVDKTYFLQLNCLQCPTLVFATVMVTKERDLMNEDREIDGVSASPAYGEIKKPEQKKQKKINKISSDDVIDVHNFFENFDGDFKSMFG